MIGWIRIRDIRVKISDWDQLMCTLRLFNLIAEDEPEDLTEYWL